MDPLRADCRPMNREKQTRYLRALEVDFGPTIVVRVQYRASCGACVK
jgi:hypothetical protein